MTDWKPEKNITSPWDVDVRENNIGDNLPYPYTSSNIHIPKKSNYICYMFGARPGGMGMVYTPVEGQVPNRFVRFMMRICLGCTWVKSDT